MKNYKLETTNSISKIPKKIYESICKENVSITPFTSWEFLVAMEVTGCIGENTGWIPKPLLVYDENSTLCAIVPRYVKLHSYGEYVFDWSWANAYDRAGGNYYPKWLIASPFSPVPGSRILAKDGKTKKDVLKILIEETKRSHFSSIHMLFGSQEELEIANKSGWMLRKGVQFHWKNKNFDSFDDFLSSLSQKKRKKIKAERRKVSDCKIFCKVFIGNEITEEHWHFFCKCYEKTYFEHGNPPYLNRDFFFYLAEKIPENFALCIAEDTEQKKLIASSLFVLGKEQNKTIAYGRYWGAIERISCLHFEVAFYSPIEWAIKEKIARIEGGAQGEHKLARGFEPNLTGSVHWVSDPNFRVAVKTFLSREDNGVENYFSELNDRNPFKK